LSELPAIVIPHHWQETITGVVRNLTSTDDKRSNVLFISFSDWGILQDNIVIHVHQGIAMDLIP
jgi:hypothetical protein